MSFRRFATGAALAIAGLAAAVGIGLLANTISGDSVGLGAEPLSAGGTLAPATAKSDDGKLHQRRERHRNRNRNRGGDETRTTTSGTLTNQLTPAEPGDDNGGLRSGSDDGSSSGSGSSGSGTSGSGSSGSNTSGSTSGGSGSSSHSGGSDDD